jgi:hypothetical protein
MFGLYSLDLTYTEKYSLPAQNKLLLFVDNFGWLCLATLIYALFSFFIGKLRKADIDFRTLTRVNAHHLSKYALMAILINMLVQFMPLPANISVSSNVFGQIVLAIPVLFAYFLFILPLIYSLSILFKPFKSRNSH